jgi:hypothetical protein
MDVTFNMTFYEGSDVIVAVYPIGTDFRYCAFLFTRWFDSPEVCYRESGNNISFGLIVNYVLRKTRAN